MNYLQDDQSLDKSASSIGLIWLAGWQLCLVFQRQRSIPMFFAEQIACEHFANCLEFTYSGELEMEKCDKVIEE
jgi:hypothetical protein